MSRKNIDLEGKEELIFHPLNGIFDLEKQLTFTLLSILKGIEYPIYVLAEFPKQ